ncbi:hypothetical protein LXP93_RS23360, partial [Escherichia coli]
DLINLNKLLDIKSVMGIRRESANLIEASSTGCNKDIEQQSTVNVKNTEALQTGCVHINNMEQQQYDACRCSVRTFSVMREPASRLINNVSN